MHFPFFPFQQSPLLKLSLVSSSEIGKFNEKQMVKQSALLRYERQQKHATDCKWLQNKKPPKDKTESAKVHAARRRSRGSKRKRQTARGRQTQRQRGKWRERASWSVACGGEAAQQWHSISSVGLTLSCGMGNPLCWRQMGHVCVWMCVNVCLCVSRGVFVFSRTARAVAWLQCTSIQVAPHTHTHTQS